MIRALCDAARTVAVFRRAGGAIAVVRSVQARAMNACLIETTQSADATSSLALVRRAGCAIAAIGAANRITIRFAFHITVFIPAARARGLWAEVLFLL